MKDAEIVALYWDRSEVAIQQTEQKYGHICQRSLTTSSPIVRTARNVSTIHT